MLETLMERLTEKITDLNIFKQIEPYEGQFDDPDEFILRPPSCFIEFSQGQTEKTLNLKRLVNIDLYVTTHHIKGKVNSAMLNIIDTLTIQLNKKRLDQVGEMRFNSFDRLAIFPGFCTYRISFECKEDF